MSADTYAALEDAIRAHIGDETGDGLLTDWVVVAASVNAEPDVTVYSDACSETAAHSLEGLLRIGVRRVVDRDLYEDEDD